MKSRGEKIFDVLNIILMILLSALFILPILLVVFSSFTASRELTLNGYSLIIRKFSFEYYKAIFVSENHQFITSVGNSFFIAVITTSIMVVTTSLAAFVLSRPKLQFKKIITFFFIIPMLFAGGTIPYYLVVKDLGLYDTLWAIIIPSGVSAWYILLVKNFFVGVPNSIVESAELDGANNVQILFKIFLPVSFPIIATVILYTVVGVWNDWYQASIFLESENLWPVQTFIRNLQDSDGFLEKYFGKTNLNYEGIRTAAVILSLLPILIAYPFMQRFFIKGTMIGSVKE